MSDRPPHPASAGSFEYQLERAAVGVVVLDLGRRVRAVNALARRLLALPEAEVLGMDILALHPPAARTKVRWLIDAAENAADGTAGMIVTTPFGSLVAKVTLLGGQGFCMMFHAVGDTRMTTPPGDRAHLLKLPVVKGRATELVDIADVVHLTAQGHYATAVTLTATHLCPLSLADLERRVDPLTFVRVHRSHLVNLRHVLAAGRVDGHWTLSLAGTQAPRVPVGRNKVALVRRLLAV